MPHLVPVDQLQPADSPRLAGEDEQHARRLAESETEWPPILVHRATMHVIDGMHRLRAAKEKGWHSIKAEFFDGTAEAAFVEAVRANIRHGLPLSLDDRRSAAERIIATRRDMSDRAIAECTGLSTKTVGGIRRRLNGGSSRQEVRLGRDGRRRPLSAAEGRRRAAEALTARPDAPLRQIAKAAGVSVGTAHDVRERLRRGEDPVAPRDRGQPRQPVGLPVGLREPEAPAGESALTAGERERKSRNMSARLQSLRRDPSLRFSESGRELLRWLFLQYQAKAKYPHVVENIPPHLAATVAELAIQCSEMWRSLAQELEDRAGRAD
ncbi:ParB N-terminal domain-containing protein [Streptomyces sp. SudanB182_2057]|uniref:ParB N-terminal domain-containing protein n=1 Tax=Streptomyces sp. SudanB182_2057 TaxID=3035281 RepID=UPI003F5570C2